MSKDIIKHVEGLPSLNDDQFKAIYIYMLESFTPKGGNPAKVYEEVKSHVEDTLSGLDASMSDKLTGKSIKQLLMEQHITGLMQGTVLGYDKAIETLKSSIKPN